MGYPCSDLIIKECLTQGIQDIISAPWLINDIMGNINEVPSISKAYGGEVENCLSWLQNNKINIALKYNKDTLVCPAITIALGSSTENMEMRTTADASTQHMIYVPSQIGKPIPYLISPFTPTSFDVATGTFGVPTSINLNIINPGQVVLNPLTGQGYVILSSGVNSISIEPNQQINWSQIGIFPKYPFYECHVEQNWYNQSFAIGLHVAGDPAPLLWLEAIVGYILLRYKEVLLERRNFMQSTFSVSDFAPNVSFSGPEDAYSRYFTLNGVTPVSWVKTPARIVEAVLFEDPITTYTGVKILSNLDSPSFLNTAQDGWVTVADPEE